MIQLSCKINIKPKPKETYFCIHHVLAPITFLLKLTLLTSIFRTIVSTPVNTKKIIIANSIDRNLISLLLIKLICNCQEPKLRFIKYDAHATCLAYFFFSIDNSEEMRLEKNFVNLVVYITYHSLYIYTI